MIDLGPPPLIVPAAPAIIRPIGPRLLSPGYLPPDRAVRRLVLAELVRQRVISRDEANRAIFGPPPFWKAGGGIGGNDANTVLLLHCDGADASTTFTDSSASAHTVTANGNAQIDTAQFKFGTASALLDGAGDYLSLDGSTDFAFGTGAFTIDMWIRLTSTTFEFLYDGRPASTQGLRPGIFVSSGKLGYYTNGAERITGGTTVTTNAWHHVAVARSGTSTKMFLDGTQEGSTYTDSHDYVVDANRPYFGISGFDSSTAPFSGHMDEARVSKGIARWTEDFTPETGPYS
jgi:hypothetical protein